MLQKRADVTDFSAEMFSYKTQDENEAHFRSDGRKTPFFIIVNRCRTKYLCSFLYFWTVLHLGDLLRHKGELPAAAEQSTFLPPDGLYEETSSGQTTDIAINFIQSLSGPGKSISSMMDS